MASGTEERKGFYERHRLRLHKPSGRAFVELGGNRIYLGRFYADPKLKRLDPETEQEYHRKLEQYLANGNRLPDLSAELTITELIQLYRHHIEGYYRRPDGTQTTEVDNIKLALRPLRELYGFTAAGSLRPRDLKIVRERMIALGWSRKHVNKQVTRIRRMYQWAVEEGHVSGETWQALKALSGLRFGRTDAAETEPVIPVPETIIDQTLAFLPATLRAMVRVQEYTGMRPGELCIMRTGDIDQTMATWIYRPAWHKTQHLGRNRLVYIGPRAQRELQPFLKPFLKQAYIFTPAQAEQERRQARHAKRVTPMNEGNKPGTRRKRVPERIVGEVYDTQAYGRAIAYACDLAWPLPDDLQRLEGESRPEWRKRLGEKWREVLAHRRQHRWAPNRLRHNFATMVRRQHGLEAAQVLLGHAKADVTQVYAELDTQRGVALAAKIG